MIIIALSLPPRQYHLSSLAINIKCGMVGFYLNALASDSVPHTILFCIVEF